MLDITLFNLSTPSIQTTKTKSLVMSGCRASISDEVLYSELEELNFCTLNDNSGFGRLDIELIFENTFTNPYFRFWGQCLSIRTDNGLTLKVNQTQGDEYHSKI